MKEMREQANARKKKEEGKYRAGGEDLGRLRYKEKYESLLKQMEGVGMTKMNVMH